MHRAAVEQPHFGWRLVISPGAGRRRIRRLRSGLAAVLADLRALDPPEGDAEDLERHVLAPLQRQVDQWDRLVAERRTVWWLIRHPDFGEEPDRPEDVEFRRIYGLESADAPDPSA